MDFSPEWRVQPWAMIDEEFEMQKLIFRKNKELIMSKNGQVTLGKWDYLSEAKSLLIDRGSDKILFNEGFIDQGVMILKLDGTQNKYFALANENQIPDLDVFTYLKKLRYTKLNIVINELCDGRTLEIQRYADRTDAYRGNRVYIDSEEVEDGSYCMKLDNRKIVVKQSKIEAILYRNKYITKDGIELSIEQSEMGYRRCNDFVFINDLPAPDGKYIIGVLNSVKVRKGMIV
jgi:hypothetical protein